MTLPALGLAGSLTACAKKEATTEAAAPPAAPIAAPAAARAAPGADMAAMDMSADAKMAKGTGTVNAVGADTVTIDHAPIPEANWPAMTMAFKAAPSWPSPSRLATKSAST